MSIQIHPNNCKILLDATAAPPYAPEKFNPNLKDVPPNIPAEVTGAPNKGPVAAVQVEEFENLKMR